MGNPLSLGNGTTMVVRAGRRGMQKARTRVKGARRGRSRVPLLPKTLEVEHIVDSRIYYTNSSASTTSVSVANLLCSIGTICTVANSTLTAVCGSVKIRRITVWPAVNNTTSATYPDVTWSTGVSNLNKDETKIRPIPQGTSITAPMVFVPPQKSLACMWMSSSASGNLFTISTNVGSIVLVELTGTFSNSYGPASQTVATATLGSVYYPYLDGATTHRYNPLGLSSTF